MRIKTLGLLSFLTLLATGVATTAHAQALQVTADIPFAFQVEGKTMPAGHYDFTEVDHGAVIRVAGRAKGEEALVPTLTRMSSEVHGHPSDAHIVFDDVNGVHTLSEVWESGFDGFLLHATKGPHTHRTVTAPKVTSH